MRRLIFLIAVVALSPLACERAPSQVGVQTEVRRGPVQASVAITPAQALAGERLQVHIAVTTDAGVTLTTPLLEIPSDQTIESFQVLESSDTTDVPLKNGGRSWSQSLILDSFDPGEHAFPAVVIAFHDTRGETDTAGHIETEPLTITVTSALDPSQAELHDIRGWIDIPGDPWWPWLLAIGGGVLVVIVGGLWRALRDPSEGPPPTAAEIARAALSVLCERKDLRAGNVDVFYTSLSDIVRQYIEGRFGLRAPRKTTAEFLSDAEQDRRLTDTQRAGLHSFLRTADLVKFAMHEPTIDQGETAIAQADQFIDEVEAAFETAKAEVPRGTEVATC